MRKFLQLLLACCFATSALAQQAPLAVDQPRTQIGTVGKGGELHAFIGLAGDKLQVQLASAVGVDVAVYGPGGALLGSDAGKGARALSLTLPSDGVYFVGVSVWQKGEYTVGLKRVFTAAPARLGPPPVDPTWGVYARLPGQSRLGQLEGGMAGYVLSWRWEREGEVLVEEWHHPRNAAKLVYIARITRGATPGELLLSGNSMGNKQWAGEIGADGSVTWTGVKGMKLPFRVALLEDARMRVDYLDKSGGVKNSLWYLPPPKPSTETLVSEPPKEQAQPPSVPGSLAISPPQPKPPLEPIPKPEPAPQPKPKPVPAPVAKPVDSPRSDAATIKARGIQNVVWRYCFTQAMGVKQFYWTDVFPADMFKRDQSAEAFRVYLRAHGMPYLGVNCGDQPEGRAKAEASRRFEMSEREAKGLPSVETHWSEGE